MRVVVRFVRLAIPQVGHGEHTAARDVILDARQPQRLEVQQMPRVFLRRPLSCNLVYQNFARPPAKRLFEARRSSAQTRAHIRPNLDWKRKSKRSLKPRGYLGHRAATGSALTTMVQPSAATQ